MKECLTAKRKCLCYESFIDMLAEIRRRKEKHLLGSEFMPRWWVGIKDMAYSIGVVSHS